ncbi:MFS transporter, partial [bacterium]|nr:MFS transporter [bacterium]
MNDKNVNNSLTSVKVKTPWTWIPTLYFAEGLPYVAVMVMASIMYKLMGLGNDEITLYVAWLGIPWIIKPLWSPFVDIIKTKRWWILTMQV